MTRENCLSLKDQLIDLENHITIIRNTIEYGVHTDGRFIRHYQLLIEGYLSSYTQLLNIVTERLFENDNEIYNRYGICSITCSITKDKCYQIKIL